MPDDYSNLRAAMSAMSAGDTLIIRDGTYTGTNNQITNTYKPPSGSSGAWTTIMAENPGSVVFDGENKNNMFLISNISGVNWIKFSGIIWGRSYNQAAVHFQGQETTHNSHIYFSQCGFYDAGVGASTSYNGLYMRRTDYALIEDCYTWGEFYYGLLMEQCSYSIFRRCVARYDIHRGDRGGAIGVYSSSEIEVQNCIVVDCDQSSTYTSISEQIYGFSFPTTDGPSSNVHVRGCFAINLAASGKITAGIISQNGGGTGFTFDNFVVLNSTGGFWDRVTGTTFNHNLIYGIASGMVSEGIAGSGTVNNSIFLSNYNYGTNVATSDYNSYYDNGVAPAAKNGYGTYDYTDINTCANSLIYPTRIETDSSLSSVGSDGGRIGPRILYQIGGSGTFYGDVDYNTELSTESLWPFPHENIIKAWFSAYTGNPNGTVTGARGFCTGTSKDGSMQTLTKYIWEYLGNTIPDEIYNGTLVDSTSPSAPAGVSATIQ